jgi:hypothetical protein
VSGTVTESFEIVFLLVWIAHLKKHLWNQTERTVSLNSIQWIWN